MIRGQLVLVEEFTLCDRFPLYFSIQLSDFFTLFFYMSTFVYFIDNLHESGLSMCIRFNILSFLGK